MAKPTRELHPSPPASSPMAAWTPPHAIMYNRHLRRWHLRFLQLSRFGQVLTASFLSDSVPGYSLEVDLIANHDTTGVATDIFGNPTLWPDENHRMHRCNPATTVLAAYGNDSELLDISSTEPFFQSVLGQLVATDINPALFPTYPDVAYDSWVTIGAEQFPPRLPRRFAAAMWSMRQEIGPTPSMLGEACMPTRPSEVSGPPFLKPRTPSLTGTWGLARAIHDRRHNQRHTPVRFLSTRQSARIIAFHSASPRRDWESMSSSIPKSVTVATRTGTISVTTRTTAIDINACNFSDASNGNCLYVDECGIRGGTGIPEGACDCDGNQLDALEICGGIVARTRMAMGPVTTAKSRMHGSGGKQFRCNRDPGRWKLPIPWLHGSKHSSIRMPMWMTTVAPSRLHGS